MSFVLLAYLGPDSLLPLTSVVATVAGVALMCGRSTLRIIRSAVLAPWSRTVRSRPVPRPHVPVEPPARASSDATVI
jgi:hypothetical protein